MLSTSWSLSSTTRKILSLLSDGSLEGHFQALASRTWASGRRYVCQRMCGLHAVTTFRLERHGRTCLECPRAAGIAAIAAALPHAPHLCELRLDHQVGAVCSNMAEMALAQAVDAHPTLHKISYTMRQIYARDITQRATMRNRDKSRLQRLQMRKMQKLREQAQGPLRQFV